MPLRWFLIACCALPSVLSAEPIELHDGDRVAMIGGTFIEREQHHCYFETLLRCRWPGRNFTFRNLGWSGDTVLGESRAIYDGTAGLARLDALLHEIKPTVILISYGMVESFAGEAGLADFERGLIALLQRLDPLKARIVLIGPIRHENLGPPLPDPKDHNASLRRYADAMRRIAQERDNRFIDLFDALDDGMTDNGIHLTPQGYWRVAGAIADGLELAPGKRRIEAAAPKQPVAPCPPPEGGQAGPGLQGGPKLPGWERVFIAKNLAPGNYALLANGQPIARASAEEWATGVEIVNDPPARAAERIRALAIEKNIQYFNQWRPANEPYIFGFRKAEQSRNRVEIPRFTQSIDRLEEEMTKLSQPIDVTYELKPLQ